MCVQHKRTKAVLLAFPVEQELGVGDWELGRWFCIFTDFILSSFWVLLITHFHTISLGFKAVTGERHTGQGTVVGRAEVGGW